MQCESSSYPVSFVVTDPKVEVSKVKVEKHCFSHYKGDFEKHVLSTLFFVERWNMLGRRSDAI